MSKELFVNLTKQFCKLARLDQPEKLMEGNAVEVNGIDFYFSYDEENDPQYLKIYTDFGIPPKERLLDIYRALLEANMALYGSNSPSFMLSPSKSVALGYHYRLDEVKAEQLMDLFSVLAEQAMGWRTHYFLDEAA